MSKPIIGVILGIVLGAIDGLTALFSGGPEVKAQIGMIVVFSSLKGLIAGIIIGLVARKVRSLSTMLTVGAIVGFVLAFIIAAMPDESGKHYWIEILIPGTLVGLILGFLTTRFGRQPQPARA